MKFITFTQSLKNALFIAERSTGRSLQLPIVSYILLETEKNRMKISATNLEQGIAVTVIGKSEKEGKIAIPARIASQFISAVKEEKIELEAVSRSLKIKSVQYQATIQGLDADDFPLIPKIVAPVLFEIPSQTLKNILSAVVIASAGTDIRPELQGVYVSFDPQKALIFAATDSFRLAEAVIQKSEFATQQEKEKTSNCIVPAKCVQEVIKIAAEKNGDVKVAFDANQIIFQWEDVEFVSRLLEGEFPNYRTIMPSTFGTRCVFGRREFADVLRLAGFFSTKLNDVRLTIDADSKDMRISAKDSSKGDYEGGISGEISGDNLTAAFNYQFLVDGLEQIDGGKVFFGLNQEHTPAMLRPEGNDSYTYVVMPIRL